MPLIALWLCFAALAQPRRFRQPPKLDASGSSQKPEQHFNKSLSKDQTRCSLLQGSLADSKSNQRGRIAMTQRGQQWSLNSDLATASLGLPPAPAVTVSGL